MGGSALLSPSLPVVHAPLLSVPEMGGSALLSPSLPCFLLLCPSLLAVITTATCKQGKKKQEERNKQ